jgi:hypothetical protein
MDDTLVALGLDPWPLPKEPRTSVLWRNDGAWKFAGVLLEGDEPVVRGERIAISAAKLGSLTLSPVRQNAAGTRVLLAPAAPTVLAQSDTLDLAVQSNGTALSVSRILSRTRPLAALAGT